MEDFFLVYSAIWISLTIVAVIRLVQRRNEHILFSEKYWRFLTRPWKATTFLLAGGAVTFMGPYTTDPTWDFVDGFFMSVLTYLTAPWSIAIIYRATKGLGKFEHALIGITIWLFSASWSYDLYLFFRDGMYPPTWWSNLILSSLLYLSAGIFWSLDWRPGSGVVLAFREPGWPQVHDRPVFWRVIWMAIPFMIIAMWLTIGFLRIFH